LAKKSYKTLSVDKLPEAGYGSRSGSCAIIRTYYSALKTCALAYEGWHYWKDCKDFIGVDIDHDLITYHETGCLVMKTDVSQQVFRFYKTMEEIECPYTEVPINKIDSYIPGANTSSFSSAKTLEGETFGEPTASSVSGAVFFPRGGYVNDPKLSTQNVQRAAEVHGAQFKFNTAVAKILQVKGRVSGVELSDGSTIEALIVINFAGPHSSNINEKAGVADTMKMSTRALRQEVAHVPAPEGFTEANGIVSSDGYAHVYPRPERGNNLLIGSEDPEYDEKEWGDDPDTFDHNFSTQWKTMVMRARQRLPKLGIPETAKGVGALYDVANDWMPIYDKSELPGFYMACGNSGNQCKNAPVAGKIMAALIEACENGHNHDVDPVKFRLDHIGHDISLEFFSGNREININSSFSIIG